MKEGNNLSYVTKMGAYGLAVAAAFAVALAVLLSVSSTSTVEAADPESVPQDGKSILTAVSGELVRFSISDSSTASGSFTHSSATNEGQILLCSDAETSETGFASSCDKEGADTSVSVEIQADADSPKGTIVIDVTPIGQGTASTDFVHVTVAPVPTTLKVDTTGADFKGSIPASGVDDEQPAPSTMTVQLLDEDDAAIVGTEITVVTSIGDLTLTGCAARGTCSFDSAATATDVLFVGDGTPGVATITFTSGDLTETVDIILHGAPKGITAVPDQGSVESGGAVFVVVTITDSAGNGVGGQAPEVVTTGKNAPAGPDKKATVISNDEAVPKPNSSATAKDALPSCGDDGDQATTDGTNGDGQCAVELYATKKGNDRDGDGDGAADTTTATRGEHTLSVTLAGITPAANAVASFSVFVSGAPASITTDAPPRVDPLSTTKITLTAVDDEDVRVGGQSYSVVKIEGDGAITKGASGTTQDGSATFTFVAPRSGVTAFLLTVGSETDTVEVAIGEAMDEAVVVEDPPDEPPSLSEAPSATGVTLTSFSGGTVEELKTALTAACSGDGVSAYTTSGGAWNTFIPGAPAQLNATFSELYAAGIPEGKILLVANCGG